MFGASALIVASGCLLTGCVQRRQRVVATALALLVAELAGLSMARLVASRQRREDQLGLRHTLARFGEKVREERRQWAFLLLFETKRPPA